METNNAEDIGTNTDLIALILVYVPPTSLLRFRRVCKQWRSLISDLKFQSDHVCRNPNPPVTGLYYKLNRHQISLNGERLPPLSFVRNILKSYSTEIPCHPEILDCCKGLILCGVESVRDPSPPMLIVCNPTTQTYKVLPPCDIADSGLRCNSYLHVDDTTPNCYYKVIIIKCAPVRYDMREYHNVAIYSSKTGSWKIIQAPCDGILGGWRKGVVSADGIIHLITNAAVLVQFQVEKEILLASQLPRQSLWESRIEYYGERCNKLVVFVSISVMEFDVYEIYKSEEIEEGTYRQWDRKYRVDLSPVIYQLREKDILVSSSECMCEYLTVLRVLWGTEDETDMTLVLATPNSIISYNPKKKVRKVLYPVYFESFSWSASYLSFNPFIQSFVRV